MPTYRTRVGPNGSISLPEELAEKLGVREGAEVEFFLTLDDDVFFHAITEMAKGWKNLFPTEIPSPPVSIREMDEGVAEGLADDYDRIRRQTAEPAHGKGRAAAE